MGGSGVGGGGKGSSPRSATGILACIGFGDVEAHRQKPAIGLFEKNGKLFS